ncbi:MAG: hypothetical protein KA138_09125 [Saprospiraceae bacterium]|jgi:hypothetical protein|nr:hypothetical protein [Lewinellaceae bacterium]MBP6811671.1 hypothetical protein [Saprospiraceae bacterium]
MMKNTLLSALIIFVLGNLCLLGLPWWTLAPIAFLVGWFFARGAWAAFFGGFIGGFLLWYATAWFADSSNGGMLSAKVGQLFMGVEASQLLLVTGALGGLLGALGALTGRWAKEMLVAPSRKRNYLQERRR